MKQIKINKTKKKQKEEKKKRDNAQVKCVAEERQKNEKFNFTNFDHISWHVQV